MKKIVLTFLIITAGIIANAQCGINFKEILEKKCSGVYLRHQEVSNTTNNELRLVLAKGNKYAVYLLNPSRSLPKLKPLNKNGYSSQEFREQINHEENYSVYTISVDQTNEYGFALDFKTEGKACALLAIYLLNDNHYKAGIYKSLMEFKYNNPSIEFSSDISIKKQKKSQIIHYKLDLDSKERKAIGEIFGFSDGKNVYINVNYPNLTKNPELVKLEYFPKYFFYEYVELVPVYMGSTMTTVPNVKQKFLDVNSGEVRVLNRQTLREILSDDMLLLAEFNNISGKNKALKEYLIKYLEKHFKN